MKKDIILSGVGGQGILSIATIIGDAAVRAGLNLKQAEVHGMSQRGGEVESGLRLSDTEIFSDLVPLGTADIILSMEPMEALRYLPYLHEGGYVITSSSPFRNIGNYPEERVMSVLSSMDNAVTIRYRDSMLQERMAIDQLRDILKEKTDMRELLKQIKL